MTDERRKPSMFDTTPPTAEEIANTWNYLDKPYDIYHAFRIKKRNEERMRKQKEYELEQAQQAEAEKASVPTNKPLWRRAIAQAKRKFDVYPSAYANAWASKWYKDRGGKWTTDKDLRKWFNEEWVDISKPIRENGKIVGYQPCGSGDKGGYPKCLPKAKAMRLTDVERRRLIARKRRTGLPKQGKPVMTSSNTEKLNNKE